MNIDSFAMNKRASEERRKRKIPHRDLLARISEPKNCHCRNDVQY